MQHRERGSGLSHANGNLDLIPARSQIPGQGAGKRLIVKYGLRVMTAGAAITGLSVLMLAVGLQAEGGRVAPLR